jgi:hypothetical protein
VNGSESILTRTQQLKGRFALVVAHSGKVIFEIPDTTDEKERDELFYTQVMRQCVELTERYDSVQQGLNTVEMLLKRFCLAVPVHRQWIDKVANRAGAVYMRLVGEYPSMLELIRQGKMFLSIRDAQHKKGI